VFWEGVELMESRDGRKRRGSLSSGGETWNGGRGRICMVRWIVRSGRAGEDHPVGVPVARNAVRRRVRVALAFVGGRRGPTGPVHCHRRRS
jgi:hypothetical protein